MKLNAIGITTSNLPETVKFYELLGFQFPEHKPDEAHLEPTITLGSTRLMIDSKELITDILGETPKPANHSAFALEYDAAAEVDAVATKIAEAGFRVVKEPWDAFWGQRYAIVQDPDGYLVDLYAAL